jgi:tripeptide aminopeptidase
MRFIIALVVVALLGASNTAAQDLTAQAKEIMARPDVVRAFAHVEAQRDRILGEWRELTEINAPSSKERERAEAVRRLLSTCKLDKVYFDAKGNLIAIRKGSGGARAVVIDAHLDTVFQDGLKIKTEIRDGKMFAPGVGDNTRNVEALLASIRALE